MIKKNIALSDSGFLFDPFTGSSFSVNPIGLEIVTLSRNGKSENEIYEILLEEYMIDKNTLEKDLYDFKLMLTQHHLSE